MCVSMFLWEMLMRQSLRHLSLVTIAVLFSANARSECPSPQQRPDYPVFEIESDDARRELENYAQANGIEVSAIPTEIMNQIVGIASAGGDTQTSLTSDCGPVY